MEAKHGGVYQIVTVRQALSGPESVHRESFSAPSGDYWPRPRSGPPFPTSLVCLSHFETL
ncbi:MAG: hypothetical protein ACK55I_48440 [bacterium]